MEKYRGLCGSIEGPSSHKPSQPRQSTVPSSGSFFVSNFCLGSPTYQSRIDDKRFFYVIGKKL